MSRATRWGIALLSAVLGILTLVACRGSDVLAELLVKQGGVDRDQAAHPGDWGAAAVGASFKVNDGVRTAAASAATLRLSDGNGVKLREKTVLRFLAAPPGKKKAHGFDVQTGEVELEAGGNGLEIETLVGGAVLEPGSRVRLLKTDQGTRFAVEIGAARLTEAERELKAGESLEIGIGRAVIEHAPTAAATPGASESGAMGASASASGGPDPAAPAPSAEAVVDPRKQGPALVDLMAAPGDSLIVHDPHPPTAIGFAARCPGIAVLELGTRKQKTVGTGKVTAAFPAGVQRYRLRCDGDDKPLAEGTVSVLADAGSRRLSLTAPMNRIDTDGRRYTILYQSLLPKVSVRWPNPPQTGPFVLNLKAEGRGPKTFSSSGPSYSLPPGALGEGAHQLWFEAQAERSRVTSVVVQFDNAAPTASISSPAERGFAPGATVSVSGSALPGWIVSAGGRELPQDSQQRFSGEVSAPSDLGALAIRFSHPQRGVHYYLRRSSR